MGLLHRKLIEGVINSTITPFCQSSCSPVVCPCFGLCPDICNSSYSFSIPPPIVPSALDDRSEKHHKISPFLIATLAVVAAGFLVVCCYAIYTRYYLRRRNSSRRPPQRQTEASQEEFSDEDDGSVVDHPIWYIRTVGLQPSVISSITVYKYKRGEGIVDGAECSVCLSEFQEDETLRLLPKCSHAFHVPCIDMWLRSHTNCPMCRALIVKSTVKSPEPEPNIDNSGQGEEAQEVGNSESSGGSGRETVEEVRELRIGIEEEGESSVKNSNEQETDIQPMRRSVSMDSLSASKISRAVANILPVKSDGNYSDAQLVKVIEYNTRIGPKQRVEGNQNSTRSSGSSSKGRSLPNGPLPLSMKRSFSGSCGTVFRSF
jgi:hypothetical protein